MARSSQYLQKQQQKQTELLLEPSHMGECAHWFEVTDGQQYTKQALIITEVC